MQRFHFLSVLALVAAMGLPGELFAVSVKTIEVGNTPIYLAVNQTTNRIYVSNFLSSSVSVIDGSTNTVVATIPVATDPSFIDVNSATNKVYVSNINSVSVIDGGNDTVVATITDVSSPFGVAVDSVTNRVYVANSAANDVAVIDGASDTVVETIPVGKNPFGVVVDSSANLVYVSDSNESSPAVSVIDGASNSVIQTFSLPSLAGPGNMALDVALNHLFVVDGTNEVVYVIDTSTGTLLATITGGAVHFKGVVGVTVLQPGQSVLVTDINRNAVFQISEATLAVKSHFSSGTAPGGIKVNRASHVIYVAEEGSNSVEAITR